MKKNSLYPILLIIITIGIFLFSTAPRYISFRELTQKLEPNILKIINDKKIDNLEIDEIMANIYKYAYGESHVCNSIDEESYCPTPTDEELSKKYIEWGLPASEYHFYSEDDFRGMLVNILGDNNYYFDRFTIDSSEQLSVLFNSKTSERKTILLQLEYVDGLQVIRSVLIGETDIFDRTF